MSRRSGFTDAELAAAAWRRNMKIKGIMQEEEQEAEEATRVKNAIQEYEPPSSYKIVKRPNRTTSKIWDYGLKVEQIANGKHHYACLGSSICRDNSRKGIFIAISAAAASNALDHVKTKHNAGKSTKTVAAKAKTDQLDLRVLKATSCTMYAKNKPRWLVVNWVKNHIIEGFLPLSHGEKGWVRTNLRLSAVPEFPVTGLHNQAVKHTIVELYDATAAQFKAEMAAEVAGMPLLHLSLDLWVDKYSSLKYMGVRLFYVDRNWQLRSRLIAVRQFNPTTETLEGNRLSAILEKYLTTVLEEFGLDTSLLFSATSDAGSDVKRLCDILLPGLWEWCVCHMLNCALVEAIGTHVDPAKPSNPAGRKVIVAAKKVVEHIRKSPKAKTIFQDEQARHYSQCSHRNLVNAAPQRWCSVSNVLEAAIVNRAAIDGVYADESKGNPLAPIMAEITELYSLIKPVADLIVKCQKTSVPTGQAALLGLAALKLTALNADLPLDILTPARKLAQGGTAGAGGGEQKATSAPRESQDLTDVTRTARARLASAIDWRFFDKRYKSTAAEKTDFLFDMQMALHPTTAGLMYVDKLASTEEHAEAVKKTITDKVVALAVELAEKEAARSAEEAGGAGADGAPPAKRARPEAPGSVQPIFAKAGSKTEAATTAKFASLGLFKTGGETVSPPTLEENVRAELKTLRSLMAGTLTNELSFEGVLMWWKRWESSYPLLARAARVLFGAPASAAVLERDFSDAGRMVTSSRSTTDAKYVEMILFLHGNLDLIPEDIAELLPEGKNGVQTKIPERLANPAPELEALAGPFGPLDLTDDDVGELGDGEDEYNYK